MTGICWHLTIRDTYDNLLIFNPGAQAPHVYSVKLLDSGSQFIKGNPTDSAAGIGVDNGRVEYSWFEYTAGPPATDHGVGIGYTNGLSLLAADNWVIRNNLFKNFHTPDFILVSLSRLSVTSPLGAILAPSPAPSPWSSPCRGEGIPDRCS
jgi:hypothetical protein